MANRGRRTPRLRLSYGEALLGGQQYAPACAEFDKLRGAGLGPRDLGVPASRACMLKGDGDRADFRALFPRR